MRFPFLLILLFSIQSLHSVSAQVIISPEIGFSNKPFSVDWKERKNRFSFLYGISGQLQIQKKWSIKTRISYSKRESASWHLCGIAHCSDYNLKHNELNVDFLLRYNISKQIKVGLGASAIRKLNSTLTLTNGLGNHGIVETDLNQFYYGVFGAISYDFKYFNLNLEYMRKKPEEEITQWWHMSSSSRTNLTISVPILSQKNRN